LFKSNFNSKEDTQLKPFQVQSCTDTGKIRTNNEDYHGYYIPNNKIIRYNLGSLFVISDGVGGSAAGEVASAEAVNVLLQEYYFGAHCEKIPERLKEAFQYTAMHLYDLSNSNTSFHNMKCTLSSLLIKHDKYFISHVGDSKVFLLRSNKLTQLTKDHTLVGKLVRLGFVSKEAARVHPNRHVLLKALGNQPILLADFYTGHVLQEDVFCLVTDGITEHVTEEELSSFLQNDISQDGLKKLIEHLNECGGYDNMTIMTVKANSLG
jgi:PPM family protein phosphatase